MQVSVELEAQEIGEAMLALADEASPGCIKLYKALETARRRLDATKALTFIKESDSVAVLIDNKVIGRIRKYSYKSGHNNGKDYYQVFIAPTSKQIRNATYKGLIAAIRDYALKDLL